ncbi:ankyrin repeat-containing domain protein [Clohesyomyces aquaticus]|uniref:Ankyrin repeat-containing domain protein n=1 Tax=Clohesyomyces aquaticus TaxID=1231657 RepID=A0A1Y1Z752_9PLEO|nr:ankyrin repeat-containing domain protein [Clohesyomyces aquaticus]
MNAFLEPGASIRGVLRDIPADLNVMYTNLLREHARISCVNDDFRLLILQWVTRGTCLLRWIQIAEIIDVTNHEGTLTDLKAVKEIVRQSSGPLLEILPNEAVSVVHHPSTEYLKGCTRSDMASGYPILRLGSSHKRLALACIAYMQAGCLDELRSKKTKKTYHDYVPLDFPNTPQLCSEDQLQIRLRYSFMFYASNNWYVYVARCEHAGEDQTEINLVLHNLFCNEQHRLVWLQVFEPGGKDAGGGETTLHIASRLGLKSFARSILESGHIEVNAHDVHGKSALWWAARSGHTKIGRLLINVGADPDEPDNLHGLKPLHRAASNGHFETVLALLEAGVDSLTPKTRENPGRRCGNAPTTRGETALMYTCRNGHADMVHILLLFLKELDDVHRALIWATDSRQPEVVERILQHPGIDVNVKVYGDTSVFRACETHSVEIVAASLTPEPIQTF